MRRWTVLVVLVTAATVGCGSAGPSTTAAPGTGGASPASSGDSAASGPTTCPTSSTRPFVKTRFVADVGGAAFLVNRYLYQPYQAGSFTAGAPGRPAALVKAGLAAATSVKLLGNARANAAANPTLCRAIAAPLDQLAGQLGSLGTALSNGTLDPTSLSGLTTTVSQLKAQAGSVGIPIQDRPVGLNGG